MKRDAYNKVVLYNFIHEEPWDLYTFIFGPYTKKVHTDLPDRPYNPILPLAYAGPSSFDKWGANGGWGAATKGEISQAQGKIGKSFGVLGYGNALKDNSNVDVLASGTRFGASPAQSSC